MKPVTTAPLKLVAIIFLTNCQWNHIKSHFDMIPVEIWYLHHNSVFAVYILLTIEFLLKRYQALAKW